MSPDRLRLGHADPAHPLHGPFSLVLREEAVRALLAGAVVQDVIADEHGVEQAMVRVRLDERLVQTFKKLTR